MMTIRALLLAVLLQPLLAYDPDKSTCKAIWLLQLPCTEPLSALVRQVKDWSKKKCHDNQETCMYEIIKTSPAYLEIKHTSPRTYKTTVMTFDFITPEAPKFCKIRVLALSPNTNSPNEYCLLYSLMNGSGLSAAPGFIDICTDSMCPPKKSAKCSS